MYILHYLLSADVCALQVLPGICFIFLCTRARSSHAKILKKCTLSRVGMAATHYRTCSRRRPHYRAVGYRNWGVLEKVAGGLKRLLCIMVEIRLPMSSIASIAC